MAAYSVDIQLRTLGGSQVDALADKLRGLEKSAATAGAAGEKAGTRIGTAFTNLKTKLGGVVSGFQSLGGVLSSLGVGAAIQQFAAAGLQAERTGKTIQALAGQYGEVSAVQQIAGRAAKEFSLGQSTAAKGVADLYGRLRPTGVALKDIETVFFGVNKAAATMNLTAADTEGVFLQLSQALGSGRLQGDELRSIMERMPAVGQAVAKVMGVSAAQVKQLGEEGKITTAVMIEAAKELGNLKPPPPDAYKQFNAAIEDLKTGIGKDILPAITPLVQALSGLVRSFGALPEPVRQVIAILGLALGAFVVIAPAIGTVMSIVSAAGPVFAALSGAVSAVVGVLAGSGGLAGVLGVIAGVLTGPAGWVALLVAAGAALWAFRDQIADFVGQAGQLFQGFGELAYQYLVKPYTDAFKMVWDAAIKFGANVADAIKTPVAAVMGVVRSTVNGVIGYVEQSINAAISAMNALIGLANEALRALKLPQLPLAAPVKLPRFADGGYVTKPTEALIGEGGEPEYVIPQSKMEAAMANYSAGRRGNAVIPGSANVNVSYSGSIVSMGGSDYISKGDVPGLLSSAVNQTLKTLQRSPDARRFAGVR
jgi:tape measure domain-containing protein